MKKAFLIFLIAFSLSFALKGVLAQTAVEYPEGFAVDYDLDGLTDEGETRIFNTNPKNSDTDGDGYFDGLEIMNSTNPLDANSFIDTADAGTVEGKVELSWPWYVTRATALMALASLYIVILLGLSIRLSIFKKIISPAKSFSVHAWLSVQALFFAALHALSLLFEKFLHFNLADIFIPFASEYERQMVALGTISFYIMALLILSSYFRHLISHRIWRASHFLNIFLYVIIIIHAVTIGTDLKNPGVGRNIFIGANILLSFLFIINLLYQLRMFIRRKIDERKNISPIQEDQL